MNRNKKIIFRLDQSAPIPDIREYYNSADCTMFGNILLTEKGCEAMIDVFCVENVVEELKKYQVTREKKKFVMEDGSLTRDVEILKYLVTSTFVSTVSGKQWNNYLEDNIPDFGDSNGVDCDISAYREVLTNYLRSTGYFRESDIMRVSPKLGGLRMGGVYSLSWAISDIIYKTDS